MKLRMTEAEKWELIFLREHDRPPTVAEVWVAGRLSMKEEALVVAHRLAGLYMVEDKIREIKP